MALTEIWAMCGASDYFRGLRNRSYKSRISGMEYESDWTRHRKSSAFTAQEIRSATPFMPWSCRISIGDSYHEFL
ncbi:hypothetical protein MANES_13G018350v8 [Manihot esculenta]|uniref:Uncharacterized protein n=1 Tax=Manihot esculenta TaxID=3983 RepID=A0ACB7GI44_MANES|nr:hypothetical protein MANES_13G018350v8 [Manihot esculenta]